MPAEEATWTADWATRLRARVRDHGAETISDFLKMHPAVPYTEVVKRLAPWVAAMQLSRLQMEEARDQGTLREAAMDSLARNLNELPEGWVADSVTESRAAGAAAHTTTAVEIDGRSPQFRSHLLEVYKALKALQPPVGWRPSGANDPLIQAAFDRGWPKTTPSARGRPKQN